MISHFYMLVVSQVCNCKLNCIKITPTKTEHPCAPSQIRMSKAALCDALRVDPAASNDLIRQAYMESDKSETLQHLFTDFAMNKVAVQEYLDAHKITERMLSQDVFRNLIDGNSPYSTKRKTKGSRRGTPTDVKMVETKINELLKTGLPDIEWQLPQRRHRAVPPFEVVIWTLKTKATQWQVSYQAFLKKKKEEYKRKKKKEGGASQRDSDSGCGSSSDDPQELSTDDTAGDSSNFEFLNVDAQPCSGNQNVFGVGHEAVHERGPHVAIQTAQRDLQHWMALQDYLSFCPHRGDGTW